MLDLVNSNNFVDEEKSILKRKIINKRLCPTCGIEVFYTNRCAFNYAKRKNHKCSSCSKKGIPSHNRGKPFGSLYYIIKYHALKHRHIGCSLTYEEFLEFTKINKCYYCGGDIKWHAYWVEGKRNNHYNLDRKNNNLGYTKDNCVICCELCNYMKRMKTPYQFIQHCKNIVNHQQKTIQL